MAGFKTEPQPGQFQMGSSASVPKHGPGDNVLVKTCASMSGVPFNISESTRKRFKYKPPSTNTAKTTSSSKQSTRQPHDLDELIEQRRSLRKFDAVNISMKLDPVKQQRPGSVYARAQALSRESEKKATWSDEEDWDATTGPKSDFDSKTQPKTLELFLRNLTCRSAFGEYV